MRQVPFREKWHYTEMCAHNAQKELARRCAIRRERSICPDRKMVRALAGYAGSMESFRHSNRISAIHKCNLATTDVGMAQRLAHGISSLLRIFPAIDRAIHLQ